MPDETPRTDLFEIIRTTRSVWRLKPEPVPNELIRTTTFHPPASLTCRTSRGESPYDGVNVTTKGGLRHAQGSYAGNWVTRLIRRRGEPAIL
jgi:hypothetical protein